MSKFTHSTTLLPMSLLLLTSLFAVACGGDNKPAEAPDPLAAPDPLTAVEPEPTGPVEPDVVETGSDCATATGLCEGGICTVDVTNKCEAPVTCELVAMSVCREGTSSGEARGKARDTVAVGSTAQLQAQGDCQSAAIVLTQLTSLSCK